MNALQEVTLEIQQGEFVVVLGPSGSGKTTLLCLAAGLERPTTGQVFFRGMNLAPLAEGELATIRRTEIGFVFQMFHLVQGLTAWENVALPLRFSGVSRREARARARTLLGEMGLLDRRDHYPAQLSGGELQRVGLARALAPAPTLILADEPTGHLDTTSGFRLLDRLKSITESENATVMLVSHDPRVVSYGDRVLTVIDGTLTEDDHEVEGMRSN